MYSWHSGKSRNDTQSLEMGQLRLRLLSNHLRVNITIFQGRFPLDLSIELNSLYPRSDATGENRELQAPYAPIE